MEIVRTLGHLYGWTAVSTTLKYEMIKENWISILKDNLIYDFKMGQFNYTIHSFWNNLYIVGFDEISLSLK